MRCGGGKAMLYYYCNTASLRLDSPREARNSRNRMASMATRMNEISAAEMRAAMIDSQLRTNDVIDPAVVAAMGAEPREAHVPAALASVAYMDRAIDLGGSRWLSPRLVTGRPLVAAAVRSEEHTSELQSLMRIAYAVFCLKKKINNKQQRSKHRELYQINIVEPKVKT